MAFNNPKPRVDSATGKQDRGGMDTLLRAEKMTQIAFILPAAVLVGWLGGGALDKWLHTGWLYIVGILLGVVAGFVQIFRLVGLFGGEAPGGTAESVSGRDRAAPDSKADRSSSGAAQDSGIGEQVRIGAGSEQGRSISYGGGRKPRGRGPGPADGDSGGSA